jgi:hypothetical protein
MKACEHGRILDRCYPCRQAAGLPRPGAARKANSTPFQKADLVAGVAFTKVGQAGAVIHAVVPDEKGEGPRICAGGRSVEVPGGLAAVTCVSCKTAIRDA